MKIREERAVRKIFLAAVIAVTMTTGTLAVQGYAGNNTFDEDSNISVDVETSSDLSEDEMIRLKDDVLAYHLYGVNPASEEITPCGLTCTLFGHDEKTQAVAVVEHKVNKTIPRCRESKYNVTTCNRCDYEKIDLVLQRYIQCCPED